jgi:hypothetical protein
LQRLRSMPFLSTQHLCLSPRPIYSTYWRNLFAFSLTLHSWYLKLCPHLFPSPSHNFICTYHTSCLFVSFGSPRINTCTYHVILNPQLRFLSHILLFYPSFLLLYCSISCIIYLSCGRIVGTSMDRICFPPFRWIMPTLQLDNVVHTIHTIRVFATESGPTE